MATSDLPSIPVFQLGDEISAACLPSGETIVLEVRGKYCRDPIPLGKHEHHKLVGEVLVTLGLDGVGLHEVSVVPPALIGEDGKGIWVVVVQGRNGEDLRPLLWGALPGKLIAPEDRNRLIRRATDGSSDESEGDGNPMPHCVSTDGPVGGSDVGKAPDPDGDSQRFRSPTVTTTYDEDEWPLGAY